ncbi:MAG: DUF1501 domain-containing protein [Phycisphaera sp. RhM]|nr:DUF1501 domain-containing protein [Phycisphaera sp. RhM]
MRRNFLKWCASAGLGLAAPVPLMRSVKADQQELPPYEGPYYIVFNAAGGWDTTYLMDPKGIGGINRLYQAGDIQTHGAHRFAPTAEHKEGGLSNEDFFREFGNELLVLNGLDYSVNNHSPCSRYMATGKLDSLAYPTFAALVAACKGPACPLSFLTFGNYSATGNLVAMSRVPYLQSLKRIANADAIEGNERSPYHDDFALDRIERALADQRAERSAMPQLPRQKRAENMLYAAQVNSKALARVTPHIPNEIPKQRLAQQAEIALASFKAGVCVSANLSIGQFDSHANNDRDQMKLIPELLEGIAYVLRRAEELQIREKLVVIAQSEMGRTPTYNKGDGKDHWSIGSIMFLGPGIEGNRIIGATDDEQFAVPLQPHTLKLDPDLGLRVRPEQVHVALRELAGIGDHSYSKQFPFEVPDSERLKGLWH